MENEIYYRVYNHSGSVIPVCMQYFDEVDYDQNKFLTEEKFATEKLANEWIKNDCKSRCINNLKKINDSGAFVTCESSPDHLPFVKIECATLDGAHAVLNLLCEIKNLLKA